ncbi:ATP-binding cassette domain-containing protein [Sneathiella sp. P13V-1]|uniref:ABC transporter ATP-binding protein n=1 Tax=Sneathiella sp. P13V-1 TaxID=2697366 RepID=UPI00187B48BF|nr:ABC transporter ATP-binding protein [Sneathiella sp. P13V-1]MBE7637259.1 ATP-binding cassette domain-containing protein [Sneathiella sp. P13V-1]
MLELSSLTSGYKKSTVIHKCNLQIPTDRIAALVGRNGMGKTTLLKTIMGIVPLQAGSVMFEGQDISNATPHEISHLKIGYVPQGREIFDEFTVEENLRLGSLGAKGDTTPLDRIYDLFPVLKERATQKAGTFSGGQQQILAIARALIAAPKLLLLDEPSEGIQPSIIEEISQTLKRINQETGIGILLVEQNVDLIMDLADDVIFLENGEVKQQATAEEIRENSDLLHQFLGI